LKTRTLFCLLLAVGFVGFTSCGDDSKTANLQAENAALKGILAQQATAAAQNVNVVTTVIATAVANVTVTAANAYSPYASPYVQQPGLPTTTVIYTVTSIATDTATRQ